VHINQRALGEAKNIYMVEEVIDRSEESDEKDESISSNENDNNIEYFQSEEEVDPNKKQL
jgi:hypothetical protein